MAESRRKVYRSRQDLWDTLETNMYRAFNRSPQRIQNSDGQSRTELWYSQSQSYTPATKRLMLSEKWDFGDIDVEQGGSGSSGECRLQELVDRVLELPPNGGDLWIYVNNNIMGQECREAASIPSEGRGDQKFSRQFLNYYEFGPRMRFGEATNAYNDTQLYRLVEGVYKRMMESSAADHFLNARSTLFCRPMPPSKIFNMISKVKPSLGSPETIQARYFNTLTDPLEPRVNKASEIAYSDSPTASHQAWFLQGLCPMCLMFGCSSHSYGIYSQLLGKVPSCCQNVGNEMNGAMANGQIENCKRKTNCLALPTRSRDMLVNRESLAVVRNHHHHPWTTAAQGERFGSIESAALRSSVDNFHEVNGVSWDIFSSGHTLPSKLRIGTKPVLWKKVLRVVHRCVETDSSVAEQAPYRPCYCSDSCAESACPCAARGFCEKYCCCTVNCIIRFPGCRCHTSCDTKCCPCYAAHRECDADLCLSCFSCEEDGLDCLPYQATSEEQCCSKYAHKAPANGSTYTNERSSFLRFKLLATSDPEKPLHFRCKNLALQMHKAKELYVGQSDVHGIGVFAAEDFEAGDFICEYAGEIITQVEADRRGIIYDYTGKSYLFTLNREFDIDATRFGNEARFINHSSKPNCVPNVKLVYGSHRIGIYATTFIRKNSELFFNYRYSKKDSKSYPNLM